MQLTYGYRAIFFVLFRPSADASVRAVNDVVTNWAWAQIAASLSGALPQLSQANLQQQQQLVASLSNIIPQLAAANFQQQQQQKVQPIHAQRFQQQQQQAPLRPSSAPLPAIHPRQHSQLPLQDAAKSRGELQHNELLPQPAFVQQKEERPSQKELDSKDLQNKKVHAEEASSFAHQLRIAYEKQLRAREEAEKKKAAEAKATNASSKKSDAHSNSPKSTENSKSQNKLRPSKNGRSKLTTASHKPKAVKIATTGGANKAKFSSKEEKQSSEETAVGVAANNGGKGPRTQEEEAAGSILLGFLSSLRDSYEDALRKKKPAVPGPSVTNDSSKTEIKKRPHQQTKEASVKKQKLQENAKPSNGSSHASIDTKQKSPQTTTQPLSSVVQKESKKPNIVTAAKDKKKASVHVSAASSLADSYRQFTSNTLQNRRHPPNYITDMSTSTSETSSGNNSTNPVESSLEDSDSNSDKCGDINSDKGGKDNPSSSEEDDKIIHSEGRKNHYRSKGPPRKRIKTKMMDEAQTTRSVLEEEKQRIDK
mgnify:CR=1 FL=1